MKLKLYNTATKTIEEFKPISENKVGLYACGPTVYDFSHIGHLRKFTMDDILIRSLRYFKYDLNFVRNITDVGHLTSDGDTGEDKLEKGSKKYGKTVWDIAKEFTDHFHKSMKLIGNLSPDITAVVTDHIQEQLDLVLLLEKKGFTYVIENDGVYFDTSKFPEYGKMAGLNLEEQEEGARIGVVSGKRNPADFALWKFEREGENRQMSWKSPWAEKSFPGWHVECSALGLKYLGEQFDIHTGGIDHIPVHHTNEIAQAEAATGKSPFVNYWIHHNFLKVDGTKMSKSLGNFYTIDDVIEKGFHPLALRLLFLTAHYRSEMNFTWKNLAGAQKAYAKLISIVSKIDKDELNEDLNSTAQEFLDKFVSSIANDLNTAEAVGVMWNVISDTTLSNSQKKQLLLEFNKVLALDFERADEVLEELSKHLVSFEISDEIKELLDTRTKAREDKNYTESDRIRDLIFTKGYKILDYPDGQKLEKLS
jgi:cysteinyl-tRNA synthetase